MTDHPSYQDSPDESHDSTGGTEELSDDAQDSTEPYDPEKDPDADPEMLTSQHPAHRGENERDPAEGPDDDSATDG